MENDVLAACRLLPLAGGGLARLVGEFSPSVRSTVFAEPVRDAALSSPRFPFAGRLWCALSRKLITSGQLHIQRASSSSISYVDKVISLRY